MKSSVPILCYRAVSPISGMDPGIFRSHLEWLTEHGWKSITLGQALDYVKGRTSVPSKAFVLTFDECFLDNWVHAVPLLDRFGVKAAFGCVTAYLHDGPCRPTAADPDADLRALPVSRDAWANAIERNDPGAFMNRIELRILVEEHGHELYGHTHTHQACFRSNKPIGDVDGDVFPGVHGIYLELRDGLPMYASGSAYAHDGFWPDAGNVLGGELIERSTDERIEFCLNEFSLCRERLEKLSGKPSRVMAWPWGEYDGVAVEAALLAGYEGALSLDRGANRPGSPPFALRRVRMHGGESRRDLWRKLFGASNPVVSGLFRRTYAGR